MQREVAKLYIHIKEDPRYKTFQNNDNLSDSQMGELDKLGRELDEQDKNEQRMIIFEMDSYVIMEYIKSSVEVILSVKYEEIEKKLLEKDLSHLLDPNSNQKSLKKTNQQYIKSINQAKEKSIEVMSSCRSNFSTMEGPPKVYEEIIQGLEAEVRKHIRIEQ